MSSWSSERVIHEPLRPAASDEEYRLHLAAMEWSLADPIIITRKEDIKSQKKWDKEFQPYRHQVENLISFCRMLPVTLLADDVGLGKTISAALVLGELMERKRVARALVICPAILGPQWVEELGSKFGIIAQFAKGQELNNALERSVVPVVVTTYQTASSRIPNIKPEKFDMLILDEAHKLRNLHGSQNPPQMAQRVRKALEGRIFKYVLMLTATPIQNRIWDLYSLIDLLTVAKGHRNSLGTPDEFRARFISDSAGRKLNPFTADDFRAILRQYVVRTRREDAKLQFPERIVETRKLRAGKIEKRMYEMVATEIEQLSALVQISLSQAMMSSPQALASQLANMAAKESVSEDVADDARRLADEHPQTAKLEGLLKLVRELKQERPKDWRLVVFTMRKETQDAIGRALEAEGVAVGFIRGGVGRANQSTVERYRADPPKVNVIVSTDAGAEGVNLQAGNVLVNYDLPWNPMVMEQRIGRIQRLGGKHGKVIIVNLVVGNSVEERIVGRLQEKLQAVSETIGDIETILESSGQNDEGSFEEMIRKLVVSSLIGQDVEKDIKSKISSIEQAKELMKEERKNIEQVFGAEAAKPAEETSPPKLQSAKPSISPDQFVMRALTAEGAVLRPQADDTIDVLRQGKPVERITFKPEVAEEASQGVFMGNRPILYLPGLPPFERLVQRWLLRSGHSVRDLTKDTEPLTLLAVKRWCEGIQDTAFDSFKIKSSIRHTVGDVICRAKAANGVDSLEKLIPIETGHDGAGLFKSLMTSAPILREQLVAGETLQDLDRRVVASVSADKDIDAFCNFYENRKREEITKAGADARRRHKVEADFSPKVFPEVVAMTGVRYERVRVSVGFLLDGEHRYEAELELFPGSEKLLEEPRREPCAITGRPLPLTCLRACAISGKLATAHMLIQSTISQRFALPEFEMRCAVTGNCVLQDEAWISDLSGRSASMGLFQISPVSGRKGLEDEFGACEITGARVLLDELLLSDVSGKQFRRDQVARSAISGKIGHVSELVTCAETGDILLPYETGQSAINGNNVRRDLLVASDKPPGRLGLKRDTVPCAVSGRTLLTDEVIASAVSGKMIDRELAVSSEWSGRAGMPDEIVRCDKTGQAILSDEIGTSSISGRKLRNDLLIDSVVTGKKALAEEMKSCEITGAPVLPDELVQSEQSGRWFRRDQVASSEESGRKGHLSEMTVCSGSGKSILADESAMSDVSGKAYSKSLLRASEKPSHRFGTAEEMRRCAKSGQTLLVDEVVTSAVSGKIIDRDLAAFSEVSKAPALPEELVKCEATGIVLLPTEAGRSDVSNKLVRADILEQSSVSGRRGLKDEFRDCDLTQTRVLEDELIKSDESGKSFRNDQAIKSAESGRVGHVSEAVECSSSMTTILKGESGRSAVSGKTYSKTLLHPSEKNLERLGLQSEHITCAITGRRLLSDEVAASAISARQADRDLLKPSAKSGRLGMPDEIVICEETCVQILSDECGTCAVTNKRVEKSLLVPSELSGKLALGSQLERCAVSGRQALPSELQACELTGRRVDPAELETCSVSHKRAIRYQFLGSDISGSPMLSEFAVHSPVSKRCCLPSEATDCNWRGVAMPKDEVSMCRLTGLTFSKEFINSANEFRILRQLLDGVEEGTSASDLMGWLTKTADEALRGAKSARCMFSPNGSARAVCCETRSMLGFKVRHAGLVMADGGDRRVLGRVVVGKRVELVWTSAEQ